MAKILAGIFFSPKKKLKCLFIGSLKAGNLKRAAFIKTIPHMFGALSIGYIAYKWSAEGAHHDLTIKLKWMAFTAGVLVWLGYWYMEYYFWRKNIELNKNSSINRLIKRKTNK